MSGQQFRGALASGGTFTASDQAIDVFDASGNRLASVGRAAISGVRRDGQVVTVERHADTIVTLTAASITDAVGLEQFVRDAYLAPPAPEEAEAPPLAFDAFDSEPDQNDASKGAAAAAAAGAAAGAAAPRIISQPDPSPDDEPGPPGDQLPPPSPTLAPPLLETSEAERAAQETTPIATVPPPATAADTEEDTGSGGRRLWLWGCLGCGGLVILLLICVGVLVATEVIDPDDFNGDDNTPTPFIITATPGGGDEATATPGSAEPTATSEPGGGEPTATSDSGGGQPTATEDGGSVPPDGDVLQAGESAVVGGIEATYESARSETGGLIPPDDGNEYLILKFTMVNTTQQEIIVSSLLQFELTDNAGETYSIALFADIEDTLDGDVPPGDTLEGEVAFEVPQGAGPFTVTYEELFVDESATWAVEDVSQ